VTRRPLAPHVPPSERTCVQNRPRPYGGWGPGLLSTGLSALLADYLLLPPIHSLFLAPHDVVSVVLFGVISTLITWLNVRERSARLEAQAQRERLHSLFMQAPAVIAIHRGPEHVYEFSNTMNSEILGHRELLGRPMRQAQPELEGQGFFELLDRVYGRVSPTPARKPPPPWATPAIPARATSTSSTSPCSAPTAGPTG
jgi:uncharacterized protein DUF4118